MWRSSGEAKNLLFYLFQLTSILRVRIYNLFYCNIFEHLWFIIFINVFYIFTFLLYHFLVPYIILKSSGCWIRRLHLCRGVRLPQRVPRGPVGWGSRIYRQHLCRGVRPLPNNDAKLSDGEAPVLLLWGIWGTTSLTLLPCPFWPELWVIVQSFHKWLLLILNRITLVNKKIIEIVSRHQISF